MKSSAGRAIESAASHWLVLPESFDPREFLKDFRLSGLMEDAMYFINLILIKLSRGQADHQGAVRLYSPFLRKIMHARYYNAVMDALVAGGAVKRFPYAVGLRPFGYRLADRYIRDRHVRRPVTCQRLAARLQAFHAENGAKQNARKKPVHRQLEKRQRALRIDGDLAREILAEHPPENEFDGQGILVGDIERGAYRFNVGRYGRVANSITNLKRIVRTALRVGNEPLGGVDIACAQPAFLATLIETTHDQQRGSEQKQTGKDDEGRREEGGRDDRQGQRADQGTSIYLGPAWGSWEKQVSRYPADLERYKALVQAGTLYEAMLDELRQRGVVMPRDALKRKVLSDVLAKRKASRLGAEYPSKVEGAFRAMFPTVYAFVRWFNADGWEHANLIRELQRQESKLVIERVAAALMHQYANTFFITLHDSIYATPRNVDKVQRAFESEFQRTGFAMRLKAAAC